MVVKGKLEEILQISKESLKKAISKNPKVTGMASALAYGTLTLPEYISSVEYKLNNASDYWPHFIASALIGTLFGVIGANIKSRRDLYERQVELETLIDTPNSTYIISATRDGNPDRYELANPVCLKNHDIVLQEIKGLRYDDPRLHTQLSVDSFTPAFIEAMTTGRVVSYEFQDEEGKYFRKKIKRIDGKDKAIIVSENITEEKLNAKMKDELVQSEKTQEAVKLLAGGIAHDLNNQLTIIIGNISMMEMSGDIRKCPELNSFYQSTTQATTLVRKFLEFSRDIPSEKKEWDLHNLVNKSFLEIDEKKGITKINLINEGEYTLMASPNLHRVFSNLASNSADAIDNVGKICVSASVYEAMDKNLLNLQKGRYVRVSYLDNGAGMADETKSKCLNPYFSTKDENFARLGRGLGLTIAYSIIKNNSGEIRIDSNLGKGTIVDIYLPLNLDATNHRQL